MEAEDLMDYEGLVANALRRVVLDALRSAVTDGFPGEHHAYITYQTTHPGVVMPPHIRAKYPAEITLALQHTFRNLEVREDGFSVEVSFSRVWTWLDVPLAAITRFYDPSVQFLLQFDPEVAPSPEMAASPAIPATEGGNVVEFKPKGAA